MHLPSCQGLGRRFALAAALAFWLLSCLLPAASFAAEGANRILAVSVDRAAAQPVVHIKTLEPVGYRYTVYDSFDPVRVVVDFPGVDVSGVKTPIKAGAAPLDEIRVSSFDLSSGKLGRVEILLSAAAPYNVTLSGTDFRIAFSSATGLSPAPAGEAPPAAAAAVPAAAPAATAEAAPSSPAAPAAPAEAPSSPAAVPAVEPAKAAKVLQAVEVGEGRAVLRADGRVEKFQHFTLGAPPRLVVDVPGVKPAFNERSFPAAQGFKGVRVGTYPDKTRVVFDAAGKDLPRYMVEKEGSSLVVSWGQNAAQAGKPAAAKPEATKVSAPPPGVPVTVEALDFKVEDGRSVFVVTLSASAVVTEPKAQGDVVRFGVRNAAIGRTLRRTIDASAFPSAVRLITPYAAREGDGQEVRFAVELKGPVPYALTTEGKQVVLTVENGPFAEPPPPAAERVKIPVPVSVPARPDESEVIPADTTVPALAAVVPETAGGKYTGQKISLVFDDADIRSILQLIGEVSDLNIIAGDEIKGTITLRLIDVPWDQALDLIMDIKGLGMIREGNVVRILPKEQIRAAEEARLSAARTRERLEDLVTEVINVSYTNLANVSGPAKELLTERGKITEDARNKQLIVKDIPSVVAEVRKLVALLDTPERQVMIEARIVEADSSFSRDLGVKWGISYERDPSSAIPGREGSVGLGGAFLLSPGGVSTGAASGLGSSFTFGRVGLDQLVLDLRISALEAAGHGKIISTPRVTTLNGEAATISQGTKIPYQSSGADGLPKTEFVDANLELTVTPVINPDDSIILDITATNSSPGSTVSTGGGSAPAIDTKEAKTKVLVKNGETTVIGGIFVENEDYAETGVPLLMKIPVLGHLFKSTSRTSTRSELLVFITPRIVH